MPMMVVLGICFASLLAPQSGEFTISTNVDRVLLPVTVLDRKGELVRGLTRENFTIYADGHPQPIRAFSSQDVPVTVGIVMDNSGSMRGKKEQTMLAALNFIRQSNPADEIFVVNFNERVSLGLPAGTPFSCDANRLGEALNAQPPDGRTALYDAIAAGLEHLSQGSHDKKALLVISDGGDNSSRHKLDEVLAMARKSNALIYTVGIFDPEDPERNTGVLKKLARLTGAEVYLPGKLVEIRQVCEHIARDLRNQYNLWFAPETEARGGYHRVQVVAATPERRKLVVRTRPGYYEPARDAAESAGRRSSEP